MEYKQPGKVLLVLSVLSVLVAALDYINDMALFGLGADSWMGWLAHGDRSVADHRDFDHYVFADRSCAITQGIGPEDELR